MSTLIPGEVILDTSGNPAQLHGAGIQKHEHLWWAWGEDKRRGDRFSAVAAYSSPDLVTWTYEGDALLPGDGDIGPDRIVERPKAAQRPDGTWVMFLHIDTCDYSAARVGYAVADHPRGPFRYLGSERPLGNLSRDIGLYIEDTDAYLLSEDRDRGLHIYRLRPDWTGVDSVVATLRQTDRPEYGYESPALVRHEGTYYLFGSDLTGWDLNDNKYATAAALSGPWSSWKNFAPEGTRTFDSQVSTVVPLGGDEFLYVGDRWEPQDLFRSPAVWLPLRLSAGTARLTWVDAWAPGSR